MSEFSQARYDAHGLAGKVEFALQQFLSVDDKLPGGTRATLDVADIWLPALQRFMDGLYAETAQDEFEAKLFEEAANRHGV